MKLLRRARILSCAFLAALCCSSLAQTTAPADGGDPVRVGFERAFYVAAEGRSTEACVVAETPIAVPLRRGDVESFRLTADFAGVGDTDFAGDFPVRLGSFSDVSTRHCITLTPVDDGIGDEGETFVLALSRLDAVIESNRRRVDNRAPDYDPGGDAEPYARQVLFARQTATVAVTRADYDYDDDDDNLIDVRTPAQLGALRWDLDGDGAADAVTDTDAFARAFPGAAPGLGCATRCAGYELRADLDLRAAPWRPVGTAEAPFAARLVGNRHVVAGASVASTGADVGLIGVLGAGGVIESLGMVNAMISGGDRAGGLVGRMTGGAVIGVHVVGGRVAGGRHIGGLVGRMSGGRVAASWAGATVAGQASCGGLAGSLTAAARVEASYARGRLEGASCRGLIGVATATAMVLDSYWDDGVAGGRTTDGAAAAQPKTASELQTPVDYTGIYSAWNLDLDGSLGADNPWHFGTTSHYPALRYGEPADEGAIAGFQRGDYDEDGDNLIEIHNAAQLNAIRWDSDGDGMPTAEDAAAWRRAFVGAPTGGVRCAQACIGYELRADVNLAQAFSASYDGGRGWRPIDGNYAAVFEGNGRVLSGLTIRRPDTNWVGLFSILDDGAEIRNTGIANVDVVGRNQVGALVGHTTKTVVVRNVYVAGGAVSGGDGVGGLIGHMLSDDDNENSRVVASYANVRVAGRRNVGGLIGQSYNTTLSAVYAAGVVADGGGGLIGDARASIAFSAAYWDLSVSGARASSAGTGYVTGALQTPAAYDGIYAAWNADVDGDGAPDDPWDFGGANQYPVLKAGGHDTRAQFQAQPPLQQLPVATITAPGGVSEAELSHVERLRPIHFTLTLDRAVTAETTVFYDVLSLRTAEQGRFGIIPQEDTVLGDSPHVGGYIAGSTRPSDAPLEPIARALVNTRLNTEACRQPPGADQFRVDQRCGARRLPTRLSVAIPAGQTTAEFYMRAADLDSTAGGGTLHLRVLLRGDSAGVRIGEPSSATVRNVRRGPPLYVAPYATIALEELSESARATTPRFRAFRLQGNRLAYIADNNNWLPRPVQPLEARFVYTLGGSAQGGLSCSGDTDYLWPQGYDPSARQGVGQPSSLPSSRGQGLFGGELLLCDDDRNEPTETIIPQMLSITTPTAPTVAGPNYFVLLPDFEYIASTEIRIIDNDLTPIGFERELYPMLEGITMPVCVVMQPPAPMVAGGVTLTVSAQPGARAELSARTLGPFSDDATRHCLDVTPLSLAGFMLALETTGGLPANQVVLRPATATAEVAVPQDYDGNDDNLIEVRTPAQLSALRWDMTGVGNSTASAWMAAFPDALPGMGCPGTCGGYELLNDLDLAGMEWRPLGGAPSTRSSASLAPPAANRYNATFEGNGYIIGNLEITTASGSDHAGLFGAVGGDGVIRNVGLVDVNVQAPATSSHTGSLAGTSYGKIAASYAAGGSVRGGRGVGGLVGTLRGRGVLIAGYADVAVDTPNRPLGGLVGNVFDTSVVSASYTIATLQRSGPEIGGVAGNRRDSATAIQASYFERARSGGLSSCCGGRAPMPDEAPRDAVALRTPTAAVGIYDGWDRLNVDATSSTVMGATTFHDDEPWDFGTSFDYPVLRGVSARFPDGNTTAIRAQRRRQPPVEAVFSQRGDGRVTEGATATYVVRLPQFVLPEGVSASWSWSVDGAASSAGIGGDDFVGTSRGSVVIAPGENSASFSLAVAADDGAELAETFEVSVSDLLLRGAPEGVTLTMPNRVVRTTIASNGLRRITAATDAAQVDEGASATFVVRLHDARGEAVVVEYELAGAGSVTTADFAGVTVVDRDDTSSVRVTALPLSGRLTLDADGSATVSVRLARDNLPRELDERFRLRLTGCPNCDAVLAEIATSTVEVGIRERGIVVSARVYLQGAYDEDGGDLKTNLAAVLPRSQPYGVAPWNYPATTTVPLVSSVPGLGGVSPAAVDWVLVELRATTEGAAVAAATAAPTTTNFAAGLLLRDGRIAGINEDATTTATALAPAGVRMMPQLAPGQDVYVLIHHRNHLSVMSAQPVTYDGAGCEGRYCADFRDRQAYRGCAQLRAGGVYMMVAGDVNRSGGVSWGDDGLLLRENYSVDADLDFSGELSRADTRLILANHLLTSECAPRP